MHPSFWLEALEEALGRTRQTGDLQHRSGSQFQDPRRQVFVAGVEFPSEVFTGLMKENNIAISMDGKGSLRDIVRIERIRRLIKAQEGLHPRLLRRCG